MNKQIQVYHYTDGQRSDKVWAIDPTPDLDGNHRVWYGSRHGTLRLLVISTDLDKKVREKLRKGYNVSDQLTIDTDNCCLVEKVSEPEIQPLPTSLWYRFSMQSDPKSLEALEELIEEFLITTDHNLAKESIEDLNNIKSLPLYQNLLGAKINGGVEFKEGPLAILFLFALRCFCNNKWTRNQDGDLVQIADDDNNLLSHEFEAIEPYIIASSKEVDSPYSSLQAVNSIAIALGCKSAPINLSVMQTNTRAAFF